MAEETGTTIQRDLKEASSNERADGNTLGDCLVELYDKCLWTDVKFRCEDHAEGEFIQAHKIVLAARSPVFKAMFFGPCSDGKGDIELNTAQSETLQIFLRYLYCDTITLTEEKALAVLEMAHCYQVPSLVQNCVEYLKTVISVSNVCGLLAFAMQYSLTDLTNCCCSFFDNNAEEVLNSDGFMDLSAECLLYILKGDTLNADEELILEAAEKWSRRKINESGLEETGANIRKCLGEAFYYIRLPTLTSKSFMECISRKGYFSVEEYADISGFISKIPDVSVSTNSCVRRCPEKEMLSVNDEEGNLVTIYGIDEDFNISVSNDVALTSFLFCKIKPVLKFDKPFYNEGTTSNVPGNSTLSKFMNKAIRVSEVWNNIKVCSLVSKEDIDLPHNLQPILSGSIVCKDLDFKHNFLLHPSQSEEGRAMFESPLLLRERNSPYRVQLNVNYGCRGRVLLKTRSTFRNKIKNPTGYVQIEKQRYFDEINVESSSFAGIKAIEFINFSNRDTSNATDETSLFTR